MIRSAAKVVGQAGALHLVGGLTSFLLLNALGGFERPVAFHIGRIAGAAIWYSCTIWIYRRDGLGSIWCWGGASTASQVGAAIVLAAAVVGIVQAGKIQQYGVPNLQNILNPAKSLAFTVCITAPFMEEVFWRSFLLRRLSTVIGFWQALAISSIAFGLVHPNPLSATAMGAIGGLFFLSPYSHGRAH